MSRITFRYRRSEALRKRLLVETGTDPGIGASVDLDLSVEPAELRTELVEALGLPQHLYMPDAVGYDLHSPQEVKVSWENKVVIIASALVRDEEITSLAQIRPLFVAWREAAAKATELEPAAQQARDEAQARKKQDEAEEAARKARYAAERAEREARLDAEREARDAEKRTWVEAHGSAYLKRACGAGYDCQRLYVTERAALEHPGATVDFDDCAIWKSRSCPSEAALNLAERVGGEVVWLTAPPREDPYHEEAEAVVVTNYLGKYALVYE